MRVLIVDDHAVVRRGLRHILADEDLHHARGRRGRRDVDAVDPGMRPVSALDHRVKLARALDIVGIVTLAAEKADIFLTANGCADPLESHGVFLPEPAALIRPLWRA